MRIDLVIEENMRFQRGKDPALIHSAQEESLIDGDVPCAQSRHDPFMRGCGAGSHNGNLEMSLVTGFRFHFLIFQLMELGEFCKKISKRTR